MRICYWVVALFASALLQAASSAWPALDRVEIGGQRYIRLGQWAAIHGFKFASPSGAERMVLTNRWNRLEFTADSSRACINRVGVRLSYAVAMPQKLPHVSETDFTTLIHPILFPDTAAGRRAIRRVTIDAGHGGRDPGNQAGRVQEKRYTLSVALELARILKRAGLTVSLTRSDDRFLTPEDRAIIARGQRPDLVVSVHFNASPEDPRGVRGVEVYCLAPAGTPAANHGQDSVPRTRYPGNAFDQESSLLAYQVQRQLVLQTGLEDRGLKRDRYLVLREAKAPAVLVEGGFMSNPEDMAKISTPAFRQTIAQAVADGILAYRRLVTRSSK